MIQFLGLSFVPTPPAGPDGVPGFKAVAVATDRQAQVIAACEATVGGVTAGGVTGPDDKGADDKGAGAGAGAASGESGSGEVRPGELVRAGGLALKDAFLQVPARTRRVWGFSICAPDGWVALDADLDPLSPLRIVPDPQEDFRRWLDENQRRFPHIFCVLTPKDYFRHAVSGALAIDATQAEAIGPVERGTTNWSKGGFEALGFSPRWFPPIFDSAVATGRISENGIKKTGLPGALWVVAGAETGAPALVSAGDLRKGGLLMTLASPTRLEFRVLAPTAAAHAGSAWSERGAPITGWRALSRVVSVPEEPAAALDAARAAIRETLGALPEAPMGGAARAKEIFIDHRLHEEPPWVESLLSDAGATLGWPARRSSYAGKADPGAAFLAGMAQGAYKNLDGLYRKLRERSPT